MQEVEDVLVGADLGGTHFRVGVRLPGEARLAGREAIAADPTWTSQDVLSVAGGMLDEIARRRGTALHPLGIGLASTGDIDHLGGVCHSMKRFPALEAAPLGAMLTERFHCPARLLNDGLAAALGELHAGAGRGVSDFLMITLGTGIGGGVVLDGRVLTGARGRVGKAGHQIVDMDHPGPVHCHCGLPGCWQALAGRDGVQARADAAGLGSATDLEAIVRRSAQGDAAARRVMEETGRIVGIGIANLVKLFAPDVVLVGGGIAEGNAVLLNAARETLGAYAIKPYQHVPVRPPELGKDAGLVGATYLAEGALS
jgi:glucokinase